MATPALNAEQAALLKKTYATKEDFVASSGYAKLTENARQIALGAYAPAPVSSTTPQASNTDPMLLQQQLDNGTTPTATPANTPANTPTANTNFNQATGTVPGVKLETPTETKTQTPDYKDTSSQRMSEIVSNLDTYFASNPNAFLNEANFKTAFDVGTGARNTAQDQLIMNWYKGKKTDLDTLNTQTLRYNELLSMSEQDLMGLDDPTDLTLINQDPNLKAKYDAAKKRKDILEFIYGKDYNKEKLPEIDGLDNLPDNIKVELANASAVVTDTKQKMDELQDSMENTYDDLVKQHEGSGATDQYLRAKANKINSEIQKQYNDLGRDYNRQIGTVNTLVSMIEMQKEEEQAKKQDWSFKLGLFESMYGNYSDRNPKLDTNITKTIERKNAKGQTIGYLQWNPETNRYDIPVEGTMGNVGGGGVGGFVSGSINTLSEGGDITNAMREYLLGLKGNTKNDISAINKANTASLYENMKKTMTTDEKAQIDNANSITTDATVVLNMVSQLNKLKSGIFNKTRRGLSNVAGLTTQEQAKQAAAIGAINNMVAKYRNKLFGASLTPGEQAAANGFLPDTKIDSTATIAAKMKALTALNSSVQENLIRQKLMLPRKDLTSTIESLNKQINTSFKSGVSVGAKKTNDINSREADRGITITTTTPNKPTYNFGIGQIGFGVGGY